MSKYRINVVPVSELPYIDGLSELSVAERKHYGLYLSGGGINDYRLAKMTGTGGSRRDPEWDRDRKIMSCCGSKVSWRHKVLCPKLQFDDATPTQSDKSSKGELHGV